MPSSTDRNNRLVSLITNIDRKTSKFNPAKIGGEAVLGLANKVAGKLNPPAPQPVQELNFKVIGEEKENKVATFSSVQNNLPKGIAQSLGESLAIQRALGPAQNQGPKKPVVTEMQVAPREFSRVVSEGLKSFQSKFRRRESQPDDTIRNDRAISLASQFGTSLVASLKNLPRDVSFAVRSVADKFSNDIEEISGLFGTKSAVAAYAATIQAEFGIPAEEMTDYCVLGDPVNSQNDAKCKDLGAIVADHITGVAIAPETRHPAVEGQKSSAQYFDDWENRPDGWGAFILNRQGTPSFITGYADWFEHDLSQVTSLPEGEKEYDLTVRVGHGGDQTIEELTVQVLDRDDNIISEQTVADPSPNPVQGESWSTITLPDTLNLQPDYKLRFMGPRFPESDGSGGSVALDWYMLKEKIDDIDPPPPSPSARKVFIEPTGLNAKLLVSGQSVPFENPNGQSLNRIIQDSPGSPNQPFVWPPGNDAMIDASGIYKVRVLRVWANHPGHTKFDSPFVFGERIDLTNNEIDALIAEHGDEVTTSGGAKRTLSKFKR